MGALLGSFLSYVILLLICVGVAFAGGAAGLYLRKIRDERKEGAKSRK